MVCEVCESQWMATTYAQATRGKTCGRVCALELIRRARTGRKTKPRHCEICDAPFWPRNLTAARRYCSRRCYGIWRSTDPAIRVQMATISPLGAAGQTLESIARGAAKRMGPNNPAWKGGVCIRGRRGNHKGYLVTRCPAAYQSMARPDGYITVHRLTAAQAIGRLLTSTECVHHMNGDSFDNRLINLALFKCNGDHKRFEARGEPRPEWLGLSALITPATCGA